MTIDLTTPSWLYRDVNYHADPPPRPARVTCNGRRLRSVIRVVTVLGFGWCREYAAPDGWIAWVPRGDGEVPLTRLRFGFFTVTPLEGGA